METCKRCGGAIPDDLLKFCVFEDEGEGLLGTFCSASCCVKAYAYLVPLADLADIVREVVNRSAVE